MRGSVLSIGKDRSYARQDLEVFNLLHHPVWVLDIARRSVWWANEAALALWNLDDLGQLQRRDLSSEMSGATVVPLESYLERLECGEVISEQWTFYPDGGPVTLQCVCSGIHIEPGCMGMLVEGREAFGRAAEADALRGVEALRHTSVLVTLFDLGGSSVFQNPPATAAFGPPFGDRGDFVSRFVDPETGRRIWQAAMSGTILSEEVLLGTRQGERWHEVRCRLIADPATGSETVLVNQQDVSERRAATGRYQQLFAGSRVPMMLIDPEAGCVIDANQAASAFYGYSADELRGLAVAEINTLSSEQVRFELRRALGETRSFSVFRHRLASGEIRDVEVHSGPVCLDDRRLLYSMVLDITERRAAERALHESEHKYRSLVDSTPAGFWVLDSERQTVQVNRALCRILGRTEAEMRGRHPLELLDDENAAIFRAQMEHIADARYRSYEIAFRHGEGYNVATLFSATSLRDEHGEIIGSFAFVTDLTETKRVEASLRKLSRAVEHTNNSVVITNARGIIEYVNPHFTRVTGYTMDEAIGHTPALLKSGMTDRSTYQALWDSVLTGTSWTGELYNRRKDGGLYWSLLTVSPIRDGAGEITHFVGVSEDITQLKEAHARVERLSLYDGLTGLPNRRLFNDRLTQAVRRAQRIGSPVALFYLDLDRFKDVNDSLSHDAGDQLLIEVANRLRRCVRDADTVARLGGDEFGVLLPEVGTTQGARKAAIKILEAMAQPIDLPGLHGPVTASIGITLAPADSTDPDVMMRNADMAMYGAKARGRNTYQFFTESMNREVSRRLTVERDLRAAVGTDQLELHYQPVVDLTTRRMIGIEALLRWHHPDHGMVPPDQFIPVAEESDLILQVGEWVLHTACREICGLAREGHKFWVAINISARQFRRPGFAELIEQVLRKEGMGEGMLKLELTESALMEQSEHTIVMLRRLRELGLRLSIDDFGTGYSSLGYLKRFPVDTLKIDRSFVRDIARDPSDRGIVAAIIAMSRKLGIEVIAEGIETEDQRDFLLKNACPYGQGYLFGRAMPLDALSERLREHGFDHPSLPSGRIL